MSSKRLPQALELFHGIAPFQKDTIVPNAVGHDIILAFNCVGFHRLLRILLGSSVSNI